MENGSASPNGSHKLVIDLARGESSTIAGASVVMSRVEREIDDLWRDSITVDDPEVSERLAELSHAVHRAARALDRPDDAIG